MKNERRIVESLSMDLMFTRCEELFRPVWLISDSFSCCSSGLEVSQEEEELGREKEEEEEGGEPGMESSPNFRSPSDRRLRMTCDDGIAPTSSLSEESGRQQFVGENRRISEVNGQNHGRSSDVFRRRPEYGRESPGFRDEPPQLHTHYQHQHHAKFKSHLSGPYPGHYPGQLASHSSSSEPRLEGNYSHSSYAEPSSSTESPRPSFYHHHHHPPPPCISYGNPGEVFSATVHTPRSFDSHGRVPPPPPPHHGGSASYPFGQPHPNPYPYYHWTAQPAVDYITVIKKGDVLSGRGGATNSHSGNRAFRSLVKEYQSQYLKAKKRDKPSVASIIVEKVREKNGRFLRRVGTNSQGQVLWIDIGDDRAREKTCQALREGAPELRRKRKATSSTDEEDTLHHRERRDSSVGIAMTSSSTSIEDRNASGEQDNRRTLSSTTAWKRTPSIEERRLREESHPSNPRNPLDEPIMIRPSAKFFHQRIPAPISVDELNVHDRELYLQDFLPPNPDTRRKTTKPHYVITSRKNYVPSSGCDEPADSSWPSVVRV